MAGAQGWLSAEERRRGCPQWIGHGPPGPSPGPRHPPHARPLRAVGRTCPRGRGCWPPCWAHCGSWDRMPPRCTSGKECPQHAGPPPSTQLGAPHGADGARTEPAAAWPQHTQFDSAVSIAEGGGLFLQLGGERAPPRVGRRHSRGGKRPCQDGRHPPVGDHVLRAGQQMGQVGASCPQSVWVSLGPVSRRVGPGPCVCRPGCTGHLSRRRWHRAAGRRGQVLHSGSNLTRWALDRVSERFLSGRLVTASALGPVGSATN